MATKGTAMQLWGMDTSLGEGPRATLRALCDTFIPPTGEPDGSGAPLHERVEGLIAMVEDPKARGQLQLLLGVLGNPLLNAAQGGPPRAFVNMSTDERIRYLSQMG